MSAAAVYYAFQSIRWPLMLDSSIIHYVVFLMQHGLKPYRQITDMNMPGAYLTEWAAMRLFGPSDIAWRIYEFVLLATLVMSMCIVAGKRRWIAGVYAAGLFLALHAAEGPRVAVERDEVIAVLIMVSYAALFSSARMRKPLLMVISGVAGGIAASIKPTFLPFDVFLLAMTWLQLKRRQVPPLPYLAWGSAGLLAVGGATLGLVLHYGVMRDLLFIVHTVIPVYRRKRFPFSIAVHTLPKMFVPVLFLVIAAFAGNFRQGARWNWERWMLAGGVAFGLMSYLVQGKGFPYHRYEYFVCLFLLFGMEIFASIRGNTPWRWAGLAAIAVTMGITVPLYMWKLHKIGRNSDFTLSLESDLQALGGEAALHDKVQCLDLTTGCLSALYHLGIVENGGYTGDMLLFTKEQNPATKYYRDLYLQRAAVDPPSVIVLSNQDLIGAQGFSRLDNWIALQTDLRANFTEVIERSFPHEGLDAGSAPTAPQDAAAYRIYIRHESPLLQAGLGLANH